MVTKGPSTLPLPPALLQLLELCGGQGAGGKEELAEVLQAAVSYASGAGWFGGVRNCLSCGWALARLLSTCMKRRRCSVGKSAPA